MVVAGRDVCPVTVTTPPALLTVIPLGIFDIAELTVSVSLAEARVTVTVPWLLLWVGLGAIVAAPGTVQVECRELTCNDVSCHACALAGSAAAPIARAPPSSGSTEIPTAFLRLKCMVHALLCPPGAGVARPSGWKGRPSGGPASQMVCQVVR